ncbi:ParA family protein [uncultured Brevundimonas sp.]|uniref:ParA family protein n=1 Tax=uncultured Brevundimonas sp. TaxID=213418 RepID=UPI0030EF35D0|tara:strand:- start:1470 stop:2240 length:771 start_codon:yes stop_codon:yes gene_type:complete
MKTIAVVSHKGGSGKTTVAVNLALACRAAGARTILADTDPVRSATDSLRQRADHDGMLVETSAAKLAALTFASERDGCDVLIIDTAGGPENGMIDALKVADLCIAVSRPTYLDVAATLHTVDTVRRLGRDGVVLFNQCPPLRNGVASSMVSALMDSLQAGGLEVCPTALQSRVVYQHAIALGQGVAEHDPGGLAEAEIDGVIDYVLTRTKTPLRETRPMRRRTVPETTGGAVAQRSTCGRPASGLSSPELALTPAC